jgi:sporulation protein YlmC with PRC-barrel domain
MTMAGIQLELLLGRRVLAKNGKSIGRLEEIVAEPDEGDLAVTEYHVGAYGALERLSASAIGSAILDLINLRSGGYRVRWDQLDVSDPHSPRLLCTVDELEKL